MSFTHHAGAAGLLSGTSAFWQLLPVVAFYALCGVLFFVLATRSRVAAERI